MNPTRKTPEQFIFESDGVEYLKLCLDITLYFVGSVFDHVEGILDFYEQSLEIIRKDIVQYETGTMSTPKPVKGDTFSLLPFWLTNPKAKQDILMLRLDNSMAPDDAADRGFVMVAIEDDHAGALRLVLNREFIDESVSPLVEVAKSLARKLSFSSGHCGYSLNWNNNGDLAHAAKGEIAVLSQRYPGIDIPDLDGDLVVIKSGLKCINWLTFLNKEYCERLGGSKKLHESLGKDIALHSLSNGVIIQAGPRPDIGDVNRRSRLPLYKKVGSVVSSLRAKGHPEFIPTVTTYDEEATEKWLARFDS
jgi:hypothetical protein